MSADQLLHAIQTIESQLTLIKQSLSEMGIREEGIMGTFDGEAILLENGRKQIIPPNYASKSMLVPGDTLRMVEDPAGVEQPRFKQIAKVERSKATGLLTRKDGKFEVICEQGSFKVLAAAIKHFEGEAGDQVVIQFAKNHLKGSWAAVEKVIKANPSQGSATAPSSSGASNNGSSLTAATALQPSTISHHQSPQSIEPLQSTDQPQDQPSLAQEVVVASPPAAAPVAPVDVTPVAPILPTPTPLPARPISKPAATKPSDYKTTPKTSSRNGRDNRSKAPSRPVQPASRPTPRPIAPTPTPTISPTLPTSQGEIVVPTIMDDDELA